jgi:glycerol-1-phosphatase
VPGPPTVTWAAGDEPLARSFDVLLLDLDGVIYIGPHEVPGAAENLARASLEGIRCTFVTNNAARPPVDVAHHLRELGIDAKNDDVVTSAQEGAELLASHLRQGSRVLSVGGPGVPAALREVGLVPVSRFAAEVVAVLQGYGPDVGWRELAEACYAVTAGADWVATNPDLTVPTPRGTAPGNGRLVDVVARTTGVEPRFTGKPGPGLFLSAVRRCGGGRTLVVGDRLDTDIAGSVAAGLPSLLVLTGVTGPFELLGAGQHERPTYLAEDLAGLWQPHPAVARTDGGWSCRETTARILDGRLELAGEHGPDRLDAWRAGSAAVWEASDADEQLDLAASAESLTRWSR